MDNMYAIVSTTIDTIIPRLEPFKDNIDALFTDLPDKITDYESNGEDFNILLDKRLEKGSIRVQRGAIAKELANIFINEKLPLPTLGVLKLLDKSIKREYSFISCLRDSIVIYNGMARDLMAFKFFIYDQYRINSSHEWDIIFKRLY